MHNTPKPHDLASLATHRAEFLPADNGPIITVEFAAKGWDQAEKFADRLAHIHNAVCSSVIEINR